MRRIHRPHILGIDDGPFKKRESTSTPIVGVVMEGGDLIEGVAVTEFPVDGEDASRFLVDWIKTLRFHPALQAIMLGSVTIAGLGVVDIELLSERLHLPVLIVNRRDPRQHRLRDAFAAAGLTHRTPIVDRVPQAFPAAGGLYVAAAGMAPNEAAALVQTLRRKSALPEPLRVAHLIARAIVMGESRGRP